MEHVATHIDHWLLGILLTMMALGGIVHLVSKNGRFKSAFFPLHSIVIWLLLVLFVVQREYTLQMTILLIAVFACIPLFNSIGIVFCRICGKATRRKRGGTKHCEACETNQRQR